MRYQRFARLVTLSCVALAFALAACTSTPTEEGGTGSLEAKLTLTFPPAGADKKVDQICGTIWCTGIDPILGVPRPDVTNPEEWCADVSTTEGEDGFGLLAKRGLSAPGDCTLYAQGTTTDGTTTCEDTVTFPVTVNAVTDITVFLNCITDPLYGGVDAAATTNSCPVYRQILLTPTTQSIGSDFTVRTEVYDPEDQDANVRVESDCGPVNDSLQTRPSCEAEDGALCTAAETTVECMDAKACTITVTVEAIDPRELEGCNGELPDGTDNDAAKQTIDVICQQALACGDGNVVPPETCDPPSSPPDAANSGGLWCNAGCQEVDPCNPVDRFCETPTEAGLDDECVVATTCSAPSAPTTPGTMPTCGFDFEALGTSCGSIGDECDGAGNCVTGQACTPGATQCNVIACQVASCPAGLCEYAADSTQNGDACDPGSGSGSGECAAGTCDSLDACTASDVSACSTTNECYDAVCDTTGAPWVCDEQTDDTNSCTTCTNNPDCVCEVGVCNDAPPDCGNMVCDFTSATGSQIILNLAFGALPLAANGSANVLCGGNSPDANGKCACEAEFVSVDPLIVPSIGDACLIPVPAGICPAGDIDCDGGNDQDIDLTVDHNLGTTLSIADCTNNGICETNCGVYCAGLGSIPAQAVCEGYCQIADTPCTDETDCTVAGDTCTGGDPVIHAGACQCSCLTVGDGTPDGAGEAQTFAGFGLNVLLATSPTDLGPDGLPCTADDDPSITIPPQCAPFTTTTASTLVVNAADTDGAQLPAGGPASVSGAPFTCNADNTPASATGAGLRTAASFLDSTLGDIAATIELNCQ